jgi:hypothetical protein
MNKIKIITISTGLILLMLVALIMVKQYKSTDIDTITKTATYKEYPNTVAELKKDENTRLLIDRLSSANSLEVFNAFDALSKTESDQNKKESLKLYAGASLLALDKNAGATYFSSVANDAQNSKLTQGYAMMKIYQESLAYAKPEMLKVFFTDYEKETKGMSDSDIKLIINKKILDVYPFGLAAARAGRLELAKNPTSENAKSLYEKYMPIIDKNIDEFSKTEGQRHFVKNTYLNAARFLADLEVYGASNVVEVRAYFDKGYTESLSQKDEMTKHFIMLAYADYLLSENLNADAETVLSQLVNQDTTKTVKPNFSITKGKDYINILNYISKNKSELSAKLATIFTI